MIRSPGSFNNLNTQITNILKELNELAQPGYTWTCIDLFRYKDVAAEITSTTEPRTVMISKKAIALMSYQNYNIYRYTQYNDIIQYVDVSGAKVGDLYLYNMGNFRNEIGLEVVNIRPAVSTNCILCKYKIVSNEGDNRHAFFQLIPIEKKLQLINRINNEVYKYAS